MASGQISPQYVKLGGGVSNTITALSLTVFISYTSDFRLSLGSGSDLQRFSDDSAVDGYIHRKNHLAYQQFMDGFVK